ncbi:hypothetical protein A9797_03430 [Edwardsiella piscicida]|uniref:hypothetical protein n=1 Tax=Edwardsiella piscicida TaxID=1263550 RepID=UPI001CEC1937|nr:hypothetical protein [Edwardsiella piscicida]AOP42171.2 hypothetical protein A9797_03430 [Edwardsiella piscicida]
MPGSGRGGVARGLRQGVASGVGALAQGAAVDAPDGMRPEGARTDVGADAAPRRFASGRSPYADMRRAAERVLAREIVLARGFAIGRGVAALCRRHPRR